MGDTTNVDELFVLVQQMDKSIKGNSEYNIFANDDIVVKHVEGYDNITDTTMYHDLYNDYYSKYPNLYTKAFKNYVNQMDTQLNHAKNDILKYVNIGKIFKNFHCNNNDFRTRLRSHIINVHKVRIWNKKILMLKMQKLLKEIIQDIGDCNDSFFGRNILQQPIQRIKNIASQAPSNMIPESAKSVFQDVKKNVKKVVKMATHKEGIQAPSSEIESPEPEIPKEVSKEISVINNVRSQTSLLFRMFEAKIVSDKEFKYVEKIDPTHWVTNPAIIASLSAVISNAAFYTGVTDKLLESGVANSLITSASPLLALLVASLGTAITKTDAYQELALNKKILLEFSEMKRTFIKRLNIRQHKCPDAKNKEAMFKTVMTKIEEFQKNCDKYYNEILNMCIDYAGVYDVICTEPLDEDKQNAKSAAVEQIIGKLNEAENKQTVSDEQIEKIIRKIKECDAVTIIPFYDGKTDTELKEQFKNTTVGQYNIFMNSICTDKLINTVNNMTANKEGLKTKSKPKPQSQPQSQPKPKSKSKSKSKKNKTRSMSR